MNRVFFVIFMIFTGCLTNQNVLPPVETAISPHNDKEKHYCNYCHTGNTVNLVGEPHLLCLRCHPLGKNDHPVNVKMEKGRKTWLPLWNNKITCQTCHDPHNKTQQRAMLRTEFNKICKECHNRN